MSVELQATVDLDELEDDIDPIKKEDQLEAVKEAVGDRLEQRHAERGEPPRHADEITGADLLGFAKKQSADRIDPDALADLEAELKGVPRLTEEEQAERGQKLPKPHPVERPRPPAQTGNRPDGLPHDPIERHKVVTTHFPAWNQRVAQELSVRQQQLSQAAQHAQKLAAIDPTAGARLMHQVQAGAAELDAMTNQYGQVVGHTQQALLEASAQAAFGHDQPSQRDVDALCDFAHDKLGLPLEVIRQASLIPSVARLVAEAYRNSRQPTTKPTPRRKRGQANKKQFQSAVQQRVSRMEAVAAKHGRHVRGFAK